MTTIACCGARVSSERIVAACLRHAEGVRYQGVTMDDLCAVSGVSERRVRYAFDDCHGVAPTAYLRTAALHAVREVLLDEPTARDAVTRAATDYGFCHLSRFAAHYRARFGETPRETVMRARSARSLPAPV
jgi:AraC-like DNA-binding protein